MSMAICVVNMKIISEADQTFRQIYVESSDWWVWKTMFLSQLPFLGAIFLG